MLWVSGPIACLCVHFISVSICCIVRRLPNAIFVTSLRGMSCDFHVILVLRHILRQSLLKTVVWLFRKKGIGMLKPDTVQLAKGMF